MASNWSESEVEAAVADYFDMLRSELNGQKYNKTAHRRALMEQLNNRSDGSVELKHQNNHFLQTTEYQSLPMDPR